MNARRVRNVAEGLAPEIFSEENIDSPDVGEDVDSTVVNHRMKNYGGENVPQPSATLPKDPWDTFLDDVDDAVCNKYIVEAFLTNLADDATFIGQSEIQSLVEWSGIQLHLLQRGWGDDNEIKEQVYNPTQETSPARATYWRSNHYEYAIIE